jgi:hypothetical protein
VGENRALFRATRKDQGRNIRAGEALKMTSLEECQIKRE